MKIPKLISFELAQKIIIQEKKKLFKETRVKLEKSNNVVASRAIISPINLPLQNCAGLDGYIISNKNLKKISISKRLLNAGHSYKKLNPKLAYKINTGAIIPQNFQNFISLENAKIEDNNLIIQYSKISNKDIKKKGEDLKKNKILVKKNEKIDFIKIALLSSVGITNLWVYKPLNIGVISSGNELIKSGKKIKDHQVYDSNKNQIIYFLKKFNIKAKDLGVLKDNQLKIKSFYKNNQNKFDIIISSGGSSFSSKDFISSFLEDHTNLLFKYVRIQPGRPVIFSKLKSNFYFSLPGNPLAVFINLFFLISLFIDPSRNNNSSITKYYRSAFSENKKSNITKFYRVKLSKNLLHTHNSKGSAKLISLAEADGLAIVPEGINKIKKGEKINFIEF